MLCPLHSDFRENEGRIFKKLVLVSRALTEMSLGKACIAL